MRYFVVIAITFLTMTFVSSGMASAAESAPVSDQATAPVEAKEQKNQSPLARRNAAAKALKAKIEKQNPERTGKAQPQEVQQEVTR